MLDEYKSVVELERKDGKFNSKSHNKFSFIIECEGQFYELKSTYNKSHPPGWVDQAKLLMQQYWLSVRHVCELLAQQVLARSGTPCDSENVRYVTTIVRQKGARRYERHVTIMSVSSYDIEVLSEGKHLRWLPVSAAERVDQVRAAVLGLSVVMSSVAL
jgi:hypothetical protein